jgi:3-oxoacyl-(acyl-carrier-protein) synthase
MTMACEVAGLEPNEIQYLNSHGTGTPLNDPAEAAAIAAWAGEATSELAVSSTKGAIGHLLGGAGAVEAAICLIAMNEGFLPATANVQVPDPCCAFELVTQPRPAELVRVLSNSFGFGGCNASLVMQREVDANLSECPSLREAAQAGPLSITGFGAVSPAGWGTAALIDALNHGMALPESLISPPKNAVAGLPSFPVRTVPRPVPDRALASHPRMRRATPVSLFAAAAALEALGPERAEAAKSGALRVGLIYTLLNGTVSFCGRFFGEVLADPATASPILFPETVFNAPASHLAALFGLTGPCASLVGDSAQFLAAIEMASLWLDLDQIDLALIVGAEEHDWLASAAADLLKLGVPLAEGAACIAVERGTAGIGIERLATRHPVKAFSTRGAAAAAARSALGAIAPDALVVDDRCGHAWSDAATAEAWADWAGPRRSPGRLLGHGLSAAGAWQCVAACHELMTGRASQAVVATTGFSQRAAAMHLCRRA